MPLEDYALLELIAETAMSEVWRAEHSPSGTQVAFKRPGTSFAARRFKREITTQIAAAGPHTMPILESDIAFEWYAMPWAAATLEASGAPVSHATVLNVVAAIAESLRPIHVSGQVHRDLKPANILWLEAGAPGRWVVADFGIVRNAAGVTTSQLTRVGGLGSLGWMAPEQHYDAHTATPRTDVYSTAAIAAWLTTGVFPRPDGVDLPPVGSPFRSVIWRATRPRQLDRYTDIDSLLSAMRAASAPRPIGLREKLESRSFDEVVEVALDPDRYWELVQDLPILSPADVTSWVAADPVSAHAAINAGLHGLRRDGVGDLPYGEVDSFLVWSLHLLRAELTRRLDLAAEETAVALFGAIADVHQFKPAREVLDWLDSLGRDHQAAMESALRMADAWEFFESQASGRWVTSRTSSLVRRLSTR